MRAPLFCIRIRRELSEVARVNSELEALWRDYNVPEQARLDLGVCLEEGLSNSIRHGLPAEEGDLWVSVIVTPAEIEIQIEDKGPIFDPLSYPPPRIDVPLAERRTGGLGIHLIRSLMDRVQYEQIGGRNRLTMAKKIAP